MAEIVIERDLQRDIVEGFAERYLLRGICGEIVIERHMKRDSCRGRFSERERESCWERD